MSSPIRLLAYPEKLAVLTLPVGADVPSWAESSSILSITATATETALVTAGRNVPTKVRGTRGLLGFVTAPAEDGEPSRADLAGRAGLLVELLAPVAEEGIAVFTTTTATAVWVLVPADEADRAAEAWRRRGHTVEPAPAA